MGGFTAGSSGKTFPVLAAGVYAGVCTTLVDVGVQSGGKFKDMPKIVLGFELPDAPARTDGKPTMIYRNITLSMSKKGNLRPLIESWFGKQFPSDEAAGAFELPKLIGKAALVNVTNAKRGDKEYANISGLTPLMAGQAAPVAKSEAVLYTPKLPETVNNLEKVAPWIRTLIDNQIVEGEKLAPVAATSESADSGDDIPF